MISYDMIVSYCYIVANPHLKSEQWKYSHMIGNTNNHVLSTVTHVQKQFHDFSLAHIKITNAVEN
jgi:hypothetical protein